MSAALKKTLLYILSSAVNALITYLCGVFALKTKIAVPALIFLFLFYSLALILIEKRTEALGAKKGISIALVFCAPMLIAATIAIVSAVMNESGNADIFSVLLLFALSIISFALAALSLVFRALFALGELATRSIFKNKNKTFKKNDEENSDQNER